MSIKHCLILSSISLHRICNTKSSINQYRLVVPLVPVFRISALTQRFQQVKACSGTHSCLFVCLSSRCFRFVKSCSILLRCFQGVSARHCNQHCPILSKIHQYCPIFLINIKYCSSDYFSSLLYPV